eukprot:scaffold4102_cov174-Ochromonas_danica.AAC.2
MVFLLSEIRVQLVVSQNQFGWYKYQNCFGVPSSCCACDYELRRNSTDTDFDFRISGFRVLAAAKELLLIRAVANYNSHALACCERNNFPLVA